MSLKIINIIVVLVFAVLSLAIFANSMTKPLGRDEQMYCTAGVLLAQGKMIYRDFSYPSQMPYHPLLYAALFRLSNTTHYLLVGRLLSSLCDVLVVVCIVGIYRCVFGSFPISAMLLGLASTVLYLFNPFTIYANGYAWNNDVVVLCVMLSFWLFITIDFKQKSKYWRIALIGALLTFTTCMRITMALVQLLFFVVLLSRPAESMKQRFENILPFVIAAAVVLIWPVWVIAQAQRAFFLNLFQISMLNSEWVHQTGMFYKKFDIIFAALKTPGYLVLIFIAVYLCVMLAWKRRRLTISHATNLLIAVLLVFVFFVIALIMPATWQQHLAMPVPFIVISFAYPLLYLRKLNSDTELNKHFRTARTVVAGSAVVLVALYTAVLYTIPKLFNPQNWPPIQLHAISKDIAERTKSPKLILTLAPLYALEGGCQIYTEFSAASFVYRIADSLSPSDRQTAHAAGPEMLEQLLKKSPPSAVILGVERKFLEVPLLQTAKPERQAWETKIYKNGPVVYFRR
jgi:4-amino-4-deoxy-L-arabinose transferase-like glycosyltransferase